MLKSFWWIRNGSSGGRLWNNAQDSAVSKRQVDYEDHAVCLSRAKGPWKVCICSYS